MQLLDEALACPMCVVSVIGDHAGESVDDIFKRKIADIQRTGITFWLIKAPKARPAQVQALCRNIPVFTIFVNPATKGGARPTTTETVAGEYSTDGEFWHRLPQGISPVTGKLDRVPPRLCSTRLRQPLVEYWTYGATEIFRIRRNLSSSSLVALRLAQSGRRSRHIPEE